MMTMTYGHLNPVQLMTLEAQQNELDLLAEYRNGDSSFAEFTERNAKMKAAIAARIEEWEAQTK